ncbi:MAG: thiol:disulfide interchange protein [Alistipes sp.]|nr:thiol:disulfide interchange protein [Alistipes sp.]
MKKILTILAALTTLTAAAQQATWTSRVEPQGGDAYRILLEAQIPARYHMYDMGPYGTDGPNATTLAFTPGEGVELVGSVELLTPPRRYRDELFGMEIGTLEGKALFAQEVRLTSEQGSVAVALEWMLCDERSCTPPDDLQLTIRIPENAAPTAVKPAEVAEAPVKDAAGNKGIWALIIEAILWGFAALLTPCVFPMVPMTVSYFLKGEGGPAMGRLRAALYGLFIVGLYTLPIAAIILITRAAGGDAVTADIFNWLATHWLPNVIFFAVFMLFAASFFGAFEITMPSRLVNKADAKADTKGLGGIFFLALTLVLVSFSCTGPIVGSVLIKSTSGEFWAPILTMLAFSAAFALPFTLFALFPSVLKKLPKSGGWLNSVKIVIGFIEVALGFKFLSVADQTYHWGLLDREIYLAIWIVVFSLLGLYLLGKIKFSHDSDLPHIGVGRLALAIAVFTFVVYMIPGMWGAPLKGLSGYLPPLTTQDFVLTPGTATPAAPTAPAARKYSDFLHLPHGLEGFFDLQEAEAYAAEVGKPLFIDFTGHGCVNCREMEARVWSAPEVLAILKNDYVICALYSDDKKQLPESDWVTTDTGKVLKSLGKINSYYALKTYGVNAQPYYVLQGRDGRPLVPPRGYDLSVEGFVEFLRSGLEAYKARH